MRVVILEVAEHPWNRNVGVSANEAQRVGLVAEGFFAQAGNVGVALRVGEELARAQTALDKGVAAAVVFAVGGGGEAAFFGGEEEGVGTV